MKRLMPPMSLAVAVTAALLLSGCASLSDNFAERTLDESKIQAVERAARANGVTIRWVNYPLK